MTRRVERVVAGGAVLLAHLLLLWAWRSVAIPAPREHSPSAVPNVTVLRLLPITPPTQTTPQIRAADPPPAAAPAARPGRRSPPKHEEPATTAPQGITVLTAPEPAASAPAAMPPALELSVPRAAAPAQRTMKDQMLNDPRANTPRANVESRIAALNGPDRWEAEPMDATRTRWRRNGKCIEVHVARNAQIDPYNQSFSPTPKAVKPCD